MGTGVHGAAFAENVAVADVEIGGGTGFDGVILCRLTESGKGVDDIFFTQSGITVDIAMSDKTGAITDFHIGTDVTERTDFDTVADDRTISDNTGWMNSCHNL